jgi:uncharacterized protein (TIGR02466 family)
VNIYGIFPTPVGKFTLGRDFTDFETKFVAKQETNNNVGNVTSNDRYVLNHKRMAKLREFVETSVNEYVKAIHAPKNNVTFRITQSWFNYTKAGQFHHKHAHPNSFISGVLYMKALRESDKIYFYNDAYRPIELPADSWNLYNSRSWWFEVGTGDLMLFPSSLTHSVEPVQGEERISLAFNTFPVGYVGQEETLTALHLRD